MKVTPTSPITAATPHPSRDGSNSREAPSPRPSASASGARPNESPRPSASASGTRPNSDSRPSASASGARPNEERLFRAHDHQPTLAADAIAAHREQTDRLETLIAKLGDVVRGADGPTVAIGSPAAPATDRQRELDAAVAREIELGKLERTIHPSGDVTYRLPLNSIRNLGYELVGRRDAFVDRGEHIEVTGAGSAHLRAATLHAARKWGSEPVVIYAEGKHLDAVIEHAVRANLNIANEHPTIVAKVAAERERQAQLGHERAVGAERITRGHDVAPIIARVRSV